MLGNLRGWVVSAAILLFTGWLIYSQGTAPSVSAPTRTLKVGMMSAALKTEPRSILPPGGGDADAGDAYREAAAWVKANKRKLEVIEKGGLNPAAMSAAFAELEEGLDLLVKGAQAPKMNLFAKDPKEVVNYENTKPLLDELNRLGKAAGQVAASYYGKDGDGKDPAKAKRYAEAAFHLGRNLYEERQAFAEYQVGHDVMTNAAGIMAKRTHKDSPKAAELAALSGETLKHVEVLWTAISGIPNDGKTIPFPGDVIDIAQNSPEPMWQTEALLKLGRMRWMKGVKYGDQRGAERILKAMADRPDVKANVKAAAKAGRDLDVLNFRRIG